MLKDFLFNVNYNTNINLISFIGNMVFGFFFFISILESQCMYAFKILASTHADALQVIWQHECIVVMLDPVWKAYIHYKSCKNLDI